MIGVTDTEKFLLYIPASNLNLGDATGMEITGMPVPEQDAIYQAMRNKKTQMISAPEEAFGIAFKAIGSPIMDDEGNVIGGLGIGISLVNQQRLNSMAQHFSATSEEIAASSQEMSTSAQDLSNSMESLSFVQKEMREQFRSTEMILGLISESGRTW